MTDFQSWELSRNQAAPRPGPAGQQEKLTLSGGEGTLQSLWLGLRLFHSVLMDSQVEMN